MSREFVALVTEETLAAAAGESYKIFHPDDVSIAHA